MRLNFKIAMLYLLISACTTQNYSNKSRTLLKKINENQLFYYNNKIVLKDDYLSIINFSKQERENIVRKTNNLMESNSFIIVEGFSPGWGNFTGLIWNDKVAYSYIRLSTDKKVKVKKVNLKRNNFAEKVGIDQHIIDRLNKWDTAYINNLKNKIGMSVLDGYSFIATRIINRSGEEQEIETIAFEQYIKEAPTQ